MSPKVSLQPQRAPVRSHPRTNPPKSSEAPTLALLPVGSRAVLGTPRLDPAHTRRLAALGLRAGAEVLVLHRTAGRGRVLAIGETRLALDRATLAALPVGHRPHDPVPAGHLPNEHRPDHHLPDDHRPDDHLPDDHLPDDHLPDDHQATGASALGRNRP